MKNMGDRDRTHFSREGRMLPPPPLVALPAAAAPEVADKRVLVGDPSTGWYPARAAHGLIVRGGRTFVPVLGEAEFWRARIHPNIDVPTHGEHIDRVWVEHYLPQHSVARPEDDVDEATVQAAMDFEAELGSIAHGLDSPPPRLPMPASRAGRLIGRCVTLGVPGEREWQARIATSEPHLAKDGSIQILLTRERPWWTWTLTGAAPDVQPAKLEDVWVY